MRDLRENELKNAAEILGVNSESLTFFRYLDRSVPNADSPEFPAMVKRCQKYLAQTNPQKIFVPWRRDPHPDHRAAYQLMTAAKSENQQIVEYPIWLFDLAESGDAPLQTEVSAFRLDISTVVETKQKAIHAHRSQTTDLIDDDPQGFTLSAEVLQNFAVPFEIYLTGKD